MDVMSSDTPQAIAPRDTYVYVDGFNLYYGALYKKTAGYKWLDLQSLCQKLFPSNNVIKIKYFSARVSGKYDVDKPVRQSVYWRALKTIPNLEIIEGRFLLVRQKIHITREVDISGVVPKEKGTDVSLATHLVNDAHLHQFQTAIIISNDSDLAEAIRIVTEELHLSVGVANPFQRFNKEIFEYASFKKKVRNGVIIKSQFPPILNDVNGAFGKPPKW